MIDDLKVYQEKCEKLELVNEIIRKASIYTGACCRVKQYAELVFKEGTIVKVGELVLLEEIEGVRSSPKRSV